MAYDALPLTEDECYGLLVKRFDDTRESVEARNQLCSAVDIDNMAVSQRYEAEAGIYCLEQSDAKKIRSLRYYYTVPSEKNLMRLISDVGGVTHEIYSSAGVDFFKDLLESKFQRTDVEEKAYDVVNLQAQILNTPVSVWKKVLKDKEDEFAWVKTVAVNSDYYLHPDVLFYSGTLRIEKDKDDGLPEASILEFLKNHNVPKSEQDLREWAEGIIRSGMMYLGTSIPTLNTGLIGMHLYEKNYLGETGLNNFITSSMEFGEDSPFECIHIIEENDCYLVRSFLVTNDVRSFVFEEAEEGSGSGENLQMSLNSALLKTLSDLTFYLESKGINVQAINEKIGPIESYDGYPDYRFDLNRALLPVS